jgi:tetratricopeptide (TPR) repeat protein
MRHIIIASACLLIVIIARHEVSVSQEIHWYRSFDDAKVEAYLQNKLLLLYFERSSSERSFKMDHESWNQLPIIDLSNNFIFVRIDYEEGQWAIFRERYQQLARRYRVEFLPTTVIIDVIGNQFYRMEDYISVSEMKRVMQPLPKDLFEVYAVLKKLESQPTDVALLIAAGDSYQRINLPQMSNQYYEKVVDEETVKTNKKLADHIQTYRAINFHLMGELTRSIELFEECLDKYPTSGNRPLQLYMLTKLYLQYLNENRAEEYYRTLRREFPDNQYTKSAKKLLAR